MVLTTLSVFGRRLLAWAALAMATQVLAGSVRAEGEGEQARAILENYCYRCHGQDGRSEGGLNVVTDLAKLVQSKRVVPGDPEGSALLRRVVAGDMPPEIDFDDPTEPPPELPRPTAAEVAALRGWIEAGAPTSAPTSTETRAFIEEMEVLRLVEEDLMGLAPRTRRWTRYFSLVHRANVGDNDDQLQSYRNGLAKLLNSLSWGRRIVVPQPIDPAGALLRIDLRDYLWDEASWEAIQGTNPYAALPAGSIAESVAEMAGCALPIARADWFVYEASRPPLYHEILRLPETVEELERKLDVDAAANIRMDLVARAGFSESGVSRNNRMIERHESAHGAYWKSYDFAGNADRRNIFANPLGPGHGPHSFEHDGGEIIFALPNGLNGYMLADGFGHRIDRGPTNIVRDPKQADSSVVNGISCMSCHSRGFIAKEDRVRELVTGNRAFAPEVVEQVEALYPDRERLEGLFRDDSARFAEAVKATGASLSKTEPVFALAGQFEGDVDLTLAAAESGLTAEEFRRLLTRRPELAQALGPLLAGGVVKRDAFADTFSRILEATGPGLGGPDAIGGHFASRDGAGRPAPSRGGYRPGPVHADRDPEAGPRPQMGYAARSARATDARPTVDLSPKGGFITGDDYRDLAPPGGLLIGFKYTTKLYGNAHLIMGHLQPVYLSRGGEHVGAAYGDPTGQVSVVKAKPGYAVGAIRVRGGGLWEGMGVVFMRIKGNRLDPSDSYESPWIGRENSSGPITSVPDGRTVVGIHGKLVPDSDEICTIGLILSGESSGDE